MRVSVQLHADGGVTRVCVWGGAAGACVTPLLLLWHLQLCPPTVC